MLTRGYKDKDKPCCSNPKIKNGAIGWKFFKANICFNCNAAEIKSPLRDFIFEKFLCNFWGGRLWIDE